MAPSSPGAANLCCRKSRAPHERFPNRTELSHVPSQSLHQRHRDPEDRGAAHRCHQSGHGGGARLLPVERTGGGERRRAGRTACLRDLAQDHALGSIAHIAPHRRIDPRAPGGSGDAGHPGNRQDATRIAPRGDGLRRVFRMGGRGGPAPRRIFPRRTPARQPLRGFARTGRRGAGAGGLELPGDSRHPQDLHGSRRRLHGHRAARRGGARVRGRAGALLP